MEGLRQEAQAAIGRAGSADSASAASDKLVTIDRRPMPGRPPPQRDAKKELTKVLGPGDGDAAWKAYRRAAKAFERDQYDEARKILMPLVGRAPTVTDLHELYGLTLYCLGRWQEAIDELELFRTQSGTTEQHPVLMDAHRALEQWADVDELWNELGDASPSAALVSEGRIVRSGADADRGDLASAVRVLEKGWKLPRSPQEHHLRRAYALADLYERSGKVPRSRALFSWLVKVAPDYGDVRDRLRSLT